jgi:mRNA interferase MazF
MVSAAGGPGAVRRGEIFWVDFSAARGSEQAGKRPALVIQNDVGNRFSPTTIVAAMTTKVSEREYPTEVRLADSVFGRPSVVLCQQVRTIATERVLGAPVTRLDAATMARVDSALKLSLGL